MFNFKDYKIRCERCGTWFSGRQESFCPGCRQTFYLRANMKSRFKQGKATGKATGKQGKATGKQTIDKGEIK